MTRNFFRDDLLNLLNSISLAMNSFFTVHLCTHTVASMWNCESDWSSTVAWANECKKLNKCVHFIHIGRERGKRIGTTEINDIFFLKRAKIKNDDSRNGWTLKKKAVTKKWSNENIETHFFIPFAIASAQRIVIYQNTSHNFSLLYCDFLLLFDSMLRRNWARAPSLQS